MERILSWVGFLDICTKLGVLLSYFEFHAVEVGDKIFRRPASTKTNYMANEMTRA